MEEQKQEQNIKLNESVSQSASLPLSKSPGTLRGLQTEYPVIDKAVFFGLTSTMSMFFLFMAYSTVWAYPWQSHWGRTTGKITGIVEGYKLWRHVYYTYQVNNSSYTYHQGFQCYGYCVSPGESVTVRYRPDAPSISVIQTGANPATFFYLTAGILLLMAFFGKLFADLRKIKSIQE